MNVFSTGMATVISKTLNGTDVVLRNLEGNLMKVLLFDRDNVFHIVAQMVGTIVTMQDDAALPEDGSSHSVSTGLKIVFGTHNICNITTGVVSGAVQVGQLAIHSINFIGHNLFYGIIDPSIAPSAVFAMFDVAVDRLCSLSFSEVDKITLSGSSSDNSIRNYFSSSPSSSSSNKK